MERFLDRLFDNFPVIMVGFFVVGIILSIVMVETVWDGDYRCLIAECRIVKK